jgi:prevent-host-death family protein
LYKLYDGGMTIATLSDFRRHQSEFIASAQREPVELRSRGAGRRAVVVSPEFFDRAVEALEEQADVAAAAAARREGGSVSHGELMAELGL